MNIEWLVVGASWTGTLVAVGAVVVQYRKNGKDLKARDEKMIKDQAARDQEIKSTLENIDDKLDDPKTGLSAINEKVNAMTNHCSSVTASYEERIKAAERDIRDIKDDHKNRS